MTTKIEKFLELFLKKELPEIRPGDLVKVHQRIPASAKSKATKKGEDKERTQVFEGLVIAKKHGKEMGATVTVRKIISGIGVEKIFPLHSPIIEKIEIIKRGRARRAKLYYLREAKGEKRKLKREEIKTTK